LGTRNAQKNSITPLAAVAKGLLYGAGTGVAFWLLVNI